MGQYYNPIFLAEKKEETEREKVLGWLYSHDYNNGLKLMEHSWLGNTFVKMVEELLKPDRPFHMARLVWAGDYADPEYTQTNSDGDLEEINLYSLCEDNDKISDFVIDNKNCRYILNHTTKEFVDKKKVPVSDVWVDPETKKEYEYRIHPLPLLTCEGNNRGGGDYRGENDLIGAWARHQISVSTRKPKGFTEIIFDLVE